MGGRPRLLHWLQVALSWTNAPSEGPYGALAQYGAMPVAVAPGRNDAAATPNLPQSDVRLNLRPGRARRLSEAGRHWAPITRQRATREERQSGRTWPTYCNKPKRAPPVMDSMLRTVAQATIAVQRKTNICIGRFLKALGPVARGAYQMRFVSRDSVGREQRNRQHVHSHAWHSGRHRFALSAASESICWPRRVRIHSGW
jgi:hypothetical protein